MKIKIKKINNFDHQFLINNFDENEKTKPKIILDGIVDGDGLFLLLLKYLVDFHYKKDVTQNPSQQIQSNFLKIS